MPRGKGGRHDANVGHDHGTAAYAPAAAPGRDRSSRTASTKSPKTSSPAPRSATHREAARTAGIGVRIGSRRVAVSTLLLLDVVLLCLIGLVMVGSASSVVSIATYGTPWAILIREAMWMAIGAVALWLAVRLDYRKLRRFSPLLLLVTFGLLLVVLVPGLGVQAMGSSRWVGFGQFRLQPSELMKLALTLFVADFIARRLDEDAADRRIIGPLLIVTGFACVLILAQPDMGTAMVLGFIALALLFVSGVRLGPYEGDGRVGGPRPDRGRGLALPPGPAVVVHGPVRGQLGLGLPGDAVTHRSGVGAPRRRRPRWRPGAVGLPPERAHRLHLLVIGEQLGIVGALVVLALLGGFVWLGIRAAVQSQDRFGALLSLGLVAWVGAETLINVGAVVGVLPVTGIPLPFISFGGSSLVITMAAAGVLVNVARQGEVGGALRVAKPARRPAGPARGR